MCVEEEGQRRCYVMSVHEYVEASVFYALVWHEHDTERSWFECDINLSERVEHSLSVPSCVCGSLFFRLHQKKNPNWGEEVLTVVCVCSHHGNDVRVHVCMCVSVCVYCFLSFFVFPLFLSCVFSVYFRRCIPHMCVCRRRGSESSSCR